MSNGNGGILRDERLALAQAVLEAGIERPAFAVRGLVAIHGASSACEKYNQKRRKAAELSLSPLPHIFKPNNTMCTKCDGIWAGAKCRA